MAANAASAATTPRRQNIITHFLQSGSARVLNSLRVGETLVARDGAAARLMFKTPALNRGLVFKDLLPSARGVRVGTKIYLPFNKNKLHEGGQTFFYDRWQFKPIMANFVDLNEPERVKGLEEDMRLLEVFETLPMFAPFLVRQTVERNQILIDPLYSDIPEAEWEAICAYIRVSFQQILAAVTGAAASKGDALERLLDKLWTMSDVPALKSLARAFGIPTETCMDSFYAWRGTLYFCWLFGALQRDITAFVEWLANQNLLNGCPPDQRDALRRDLKSLHDDIFRRLMAVERLLAEYELGFNDMFVGGAGPRRFIEFLSNAPSRFTECGVSIGILQHAHEVWDRQTESFPKRLVNHEAVNEIIFAVKGVIETSF